MSSLFATKRTLFLVYSIAYSCCYSCYHLWLASVINFFCCLSFSLTIVVTVFLSEAGNKVSRKDSLALKLALRPNRQELIDRNILPQHSETDRKVFREAIGAKLTRSVTSYC